MLYNYLLNSLVIKTKYDLEQKLPNIQNGATYAIRTLTLYYDIPSYKVE